ncbi:hypothetical protein HD806DRAFT_514367 [Xylariaceae sp. AK1471]|nr:hypothetical protein HD806DRAFT_514367 [Xylariaceae sp. AK1471]
MDSSAPGPAKSAGQPPGLVVPPGQDYEVPAPIPKDHRKLYRMIHIQRPRLLTEITSCEVKLDTVSPAEIEAHQRNINKKKADLTALDQRIQRAHTVKLEQDYIHANSRKNRLVQSTHTSLQTHLGPTPTGQTPLVPGQALSLNQIPLAPGQASLSPGQTSFSPGQTFSSGQTPLALSQPPVVQTPPIVQAPVLQPHVLGEIGGLAPSAGLSTSSNSNPTGLTIANLGIALSSLSGHSPDVNLERSRILQAIEVLTKPAPTTTTVTSSTTEDTSPPAIKEKIIIEISDDSGDDELVKTENPDVLN